MPLGFLLGLVKNVNELPNFEHYKPSLAPADIVYIGLRDVDTAEKRLIKKLGIKAYSGAKDLLAVGFLSAKSWRHCEHDLDFEVIP